MFVYTNRKLHPYNISKAVKEKILSDVVDIKHRPIIKYWLDGMSYTQISIETGYSTRQIQRIIPAYTTNLLFEYTKRLIEITGG